MINKNLLGLFSFVCISGISFAAYSYPAQGLTDKSQKKSSFQHEVYQSVTEKTKYDPIIVEKSNNVENQSTIEQPQPLHIARAVFSGKASWYGPGFHGRFTANGERYNQYALTAAHRSLPFGTRVRVTNMNNGRSVVVRINDRGPFIRGRVIDLSTAAASNIGMIHHGVVPVRVQVIR
ncbi:MAG: septal ring lytic transglycosylase RlpA family protein [Xenococcaceae cyanobacterium MO_188.B29]|nr:septal ring lytic transglycosylase RlpA family protein [Xenococcaceae cyanobacterium MO_188.B29]